MCVNIAGGNGSHFMRQKNLSELKNDLKSSASDRSTKYLASDLNKVDLF